MKKKIVLTGGGSGGHILPNLALVPFLKKDFDIFYIGGEDGMEKGLAARHGLPFYSVPCVKFKRSLSPANFAIPFVLNQGVRQAKQILRDIKPDVLFGKGGYVALPVVMAARSLNIPYMIHESDMSMGLSNKLVAKGADFVCGSFADAVSGLSNGVHTGAPIRNELHAGNADKARRQLGISSSKPILLVMGGSGGALAINECLAGCLDTLTKKYEVIHLTGRGKSSQFSADSCQKSDFEKLKTVNCQLSTYSYHPLEFTNDIHHLYAAADLCVTRGGAGALFELITLKIPALVIPLPKSRSSRGDQIQNARRMAELGYCAVLPQGGLTPESLIYSIDNLSKRAPTLKSAMRSARNIDGSQKIIELIKQCAKIGTHYHA